MLKIQNRTKLIGLKAYDRELSYLDITGYEDRYIFGFLDVDDGKGWNKGRQIHLERKPEPDGTYRMFMMGIATDTSIYLTLDELRHRARVVNAIVDCMGLGKQWWETNYPNN